MNIFHLSTTLLSISLLLFLLLSLGYWHREEPSSKLSNWYYLAKLSLLQLGISYFLQSSSHSLTVLLILGLHAMRTSTYLQAIQTDYFQEANKLKIIHKLILYCSLIYFAAFLYEASLSISANTAMIVELNLGIEVLTKAKMLALLSCLTFLIFKARNKFKRHLGAYAASLPTCLISIYFLFYTPSSESYYLLNFCYACEMIILVLRKQKNMIAKNQKIKNDLWEAKQLSQKWYLLRNIAHDIRSPLTTSVEQFDCLASYVNTKGVAQEDIQSTLEKGKKAMLRINKIVSQYLGMLEPGETADESVNLYSAVNEALMLCETTSSRIKNLEVVVNIPQHIELRAQENQIVMMLVNLTNNALDALKTHKQPMLKFEAKMTKSILTIRISDNGIGIPKENRDNIFKKGFTTKKQGTGLGLDFVKLVVHNHDGRIFIDPEEKHTCFVIEFILP